MRLFFTQFLVIGCLLLLKRCSTATNSTNFFSSLSSPESTEEDEKANISRISNYGQLSLPPGYNKLAIPISSKGYRVYAYITIFIRTILEVDEKNEELVLDTDFGMLWADWKIYEYHLASNWTDPKTGVPLNNRVLDSEVLKHIWKPDIYIDEMSSVDRTSILSKLITLNFRVDGDIVYSARTTLKLRCDMSFEYYPADTQTCQFYLRSYSYPEDLLVLHWNKKGKGIYLDDPSDPNFDLQIDSVEPHKELKKLVIEERFDRFRKGNYSALQFTIKARRKLSYHIVQTYLPSILLILITWLCFLLPSNMVEARIGISMTTVLTLTAMFSAVRGQSPEVSYTMAIDIWMVFCIFFVFLALLLFTLIYWMKLRLKRLQNGKKNIEGGENDTISDSKASSVHDTKERYDFVVQVTKNYAFWIFAVTFVIFLISYWVWLLYSSNYFEWTPHPDYNAEGDVSDFEDDESNLYRYHEEKKGEDSEEILDNLDELFANITNSFNELNNLLEELESEDSSEMTTVNNLDNGTYPTTQKTA